MRKDKGFLTPNQFANLLCSEKFGPKMGRVDYKFVESMIRGIADTRKVNLTDIARSLGEDIRLHATHKRLSRNLDNPKLSADLSERLLRFGALGVSESTRLIINLYELNKKYARKVEYLPEAKADAHAGFKVCEILASDVGSKIYKPLLVSVWSDQIPGYQSDSDEVLKTLNRVKEATGGKGVFYFDDTSFSSQMLPYVVKDSNLRFIAMARDCNLSADYRNERWSLQSLADSIDTVYGRTLFKLVPEGTSGTQRKTDVDVFIHAGSVAIKLSEFNRGLSMIALKSRSRFHGELTVPMLTSETKLRSRKALMGLVESFLSLRDILHIHQSVRDSFEPSSFRVLTYDRLTLLMTFLLAVVHYEVSMANKVMVRDHVFSDTPHDGRLDRTYILPEGMKSDSQ